MHKLRARQTTLADARNAEESKRQRQQMWTDDLAKRASSDDAHYADRINALFETLDEKTKRNLVIEDSTMLLKGGGQIAIAWWQSDSTREERRAIAARTHLESNLRRFPGDLPVLGVVEAPKPVDVNEGLFTAPGVLTK